jgi:hypothetical protein
MSNGNGESLRQGIDTALKVSQLVFALCLPIGGWMITEIIEHGQRVVAIENSRFTEADGEKIASRLNAIEAWQAAAPPSKYTQSVDAKFASMESKIDKLTGIISSLTVQVAVLSREVETHRKKSD